MESDIKKLVTYIIAEFVVFLVLLFFLFYLIARFDLDFRVEELKDNVIVILPMIIGIVLVLVLTKLILNLLRPAFDRLFEGRMRSHAEIKMMWQLIANLVWIVIIILVISIAVGDFTGLLAFGVVLAALLYILQRPILNMAGWLDIIFHRPYRIGDRIEVDDKKGYVTDVGMFHTTMREFGNWMGGDTYTGRLITFPNSSVFETSVTNYTRDNPYIWDEIKIAITYESNHELAKQYIIESAMEVVGESMRKYSKAMASKMDVKDLKRELLEEPVLRMEFSDSCVNYFVIYFCEAAKRREVKSDITDKILTRIQKDKKVQIAYPHIEIVGVK